MLSSALPIRSNASRGRFASRSICASVSSNCARAWLLPLWERALAEPDLLSDSQHVRLVQALESGLVVDAAHQSANHDWLARIELAQQRAPRDARLQYLAGSLCMKCQLWGKAQQLLAQAATGLQARDLRASAWRLLAELAEQRNDAAAAAHAWKQAALA